MFETAELGQKIPKREFRDREVALWESLVQAQREIRDYAGFEVMIDFAGVRGAGKLSMINLLNKWMDARWIVTQAYGEPTDDERLRPEYWRFWRDLPAKGRIGLYLSGRYSRPLIDYVYGTITELEFRKRLDRIVAFERMLADDGTLILKFWMHLSRDLQKKRLKALENDPLEQWRVTETDWKHWKLYDSFIAAAELLISHTSTGYAPWHIVEGQDFCYRSLKVGEIVRNAMANHLEASRLNDRFFGERQDRMQQDECLSGPTGQTGETGEAGETGELADSEKNRRVVTVLDTLRTSKRLSKKDYKNAMKKYAGELHTLQHQALSKGISTILVFEGPDAAGKGGIIRRLTSGLDALNYKVAAFGAPTDEEASQHYLWRFWRWLPPAGRMTIFDRSWYGRVLVERVEGFATESEWRRAYGEINDFEAQLIEHRIVLLKFWIHVTKDEQLARFKAREETPHKRWKLNDEDWRNRSKWEQYELAVHDMIQQTSTAVAPWLMVEGNCKLYSRAKVMETVCQSLAAAVAA
jgi:polyphosphate kinase 2 (PPK2 family)